MPVKRLSDEILVDGCHAIGLVVIGGECRLGVLQQGLVVGIRGRLQPANQVFDVAAAGSGVAGCRLRGGGRVGGGKRRLIGSREQIGFKAGRGTIGGGASA